MMLPILISVSVTPVSYFFCATAGALTAAMISPASPSTRPGERPSVLMKSLAQRFMNFLPSAELLRLLSDGFLRRFWMASTIAGVPVSRKPQDVKRRFVAWRDCAAATALLPYVGNFAERESFSQTWLPAAAERRNSGKPDARSVFLRGTNLTRA